MRLDYSADNGHGFWLDVGEDERVTALIRQRTSEIRRKLDAEAEWRGLLKKMRTIIKSQ